RVVTMVHSDLGAGHLDLSGLLQRVRTHESHVLEVGPARELLLKGVVDVQPKICVRGASLLLVSGSGSTVVAGHREEDDVRRQAGSVADRLSEHTASRTDQGYEVRAVGVLSLSSVDVGRQWVPTV